MLLILATNFVFPGVFFMGFNLLGMEDVVFFFWMNCSIYYIGIGNASLDGFSHLGLAYGS